MESGLCTLLPAISNQPSSFKALKWHTALHQALLQISPQLCLLPESIFLLTTDLPLSGFSNKCPSVAMDSFVCATCFIPFSPLPLSVKPVLILCGFAHPGPHYRHPRLHTLHQRTNISPLALNRCCVCDHRDTVLMSHQLACRKVNM